MVYIGLETNLHNWGVTHCTRFHYNHKSMFNLGCNCMYNFASNIHSKSIFLWFCMWWSSTICIGSPLLAVSSLAPLPDSRQPGAQKRVRKSLMNGKPQLIFWWYSKCSTVKSISILNLDVAPIPKPSRIPFRIWLPAASKLGSIKNYAITQPPVHHPIPPPQCCARANRGTWTHSWWCRASGKHWVSPRSSREKNGGFLRWGYPRLSLHGLFHGKFYESMDDLPSGNLT